MGNEPHLTYLAGVDGLLQKSPAQDAKLHSFQALTKENSRARSAPDPSKLLRRHIHKVRPNPLPVDYHNSQKSLKVTRGCSIIITSGEVKQRTNTASSPSRAPSRPVSLMGSARRKSPPKRPSPSEGLCLAPSPLAHDHSITPRPNRLLYAV